MGEDGLGRWGHTNDGFWREVRHGAQRVWKSLYQLLVQVLKLGIPRRVSRFNLAVSAMATFSVSSWALPAVVSTHPFEP
jgi:hypothetical protein